MMTSHANSVFVRSVDYGATADDVEAAFNQEIGGVVRVVLLREQGSSHHRGCGFVRFLNSHYAQVALDTEHIWVRGRTVFIEEKRQREERPPKVARVEYP